MKLLRITGLEEAGIVEEERKAAVSVLRTLNRSRN